MAMKVSVLNTKTNVCMDFQSIAHAKSVCIPQSAKTGYTYKVFNTDTGELVGNIRPNPRRYKTNKATARFIRQD